MKGKGEVTPQAAFLQQRLPAETTGEMAPKSVDPQADGLTADNHAALSEQIFYICGAQCKPVVGPDGIRDRFARVTEAFEAWEGGW